jgi:shikimate dehydrogenase
MIKKFGIVAYPAKHSLSPVIHNAAFKAAGLSDYQYGIFDIPEGEFQDFMENYVKHEPIYGLSVSAPYKQTVMNYLTEIDEAARAIGAVNTVAYKGGFLHGYNTDYLGANAALSEVISLKGKKVVIIGAGGASRAVLYGVLKAGVSSVEIFNRTASRAVELAREFGEKVEGRALSDLSECAGGDILIQCSSSLDVNVNVERFSVVMDLVYNPLKTPLLQAAEKLGKTIITGEKMLLYQAVEQFKIWTEKEAPVEVMREALANVL